ncbi:hypothetical protein ACFE04_023212 [Oxalis oulophora]
MMLKSIVREFRDGIGSKSLEKACWRCRASSVIAPDEPTTQSESLQPQGRWADLPSELLFDIIQRVEESETKWPARTAVVSCGSVCKSWREVTNEIVKTPEQCGQLTFPISLKQPGPREAPIHCYIRRDRASSTYFLYHGLVPSEMGNDKLLLAAKRIRRATCTEFVISLVSDDFSRASNTYVGKLRSNFLGTKFNIFDTQPPCGGASPTQQSGRAHKFHSKQVSPRMPVCNYNIGSVSYELNVLRTKGPRRMHCVMDSIPFSSIEEGGTAPTPTNLAHFLDQSISPPPEITKGKDFITNSSFPSPIQPVGAVDPLVLKNKAPRWHEQLQCWCLNFKGRVTVASVKNFQLAAAVEPFHNIGEPEQDRTILQFGKIGKDIFTMDYCYPLSAFQAFAVCLSSFDTKPVCE